MLPRRQAVLLITALAFASVGACDKVPLLAPTGTVITLLPTTTTVSLNSQVQIVATAIENGQAPTGTGSGSGTTSTSRAGSGTPVQNGTVISFTTTIGTIQPQEARTHDGQVTVALVTGGQSGTAHITAYSGGASASIDLKVGTAAAKTVTLTTNPQSLGAAGGSAQVIANVTDEGGSPLGGVPVSFSTDKGTISPTTATTDANGTATATLTTTMTAKITATVGSLTPATATVNVNARSLASFAASTQTSTAGVPVTFTIKLATGANVSNVHVDFGDGSSTDTGPISADTSVSHAYSSPGTFTATASARDASGNPESALSTQVIVGALAVTLSAAPNPAVVGSPVTFAVGGVSNAAVDHYLWTWDDGTAPYTTGGPQTTHTFTSRGTKTVRVDVVGVNGGVIGSATLQMTVQ